MMESSAKSAIAQLAARQAETVDTISFTRAMQLMNGRLRLIDGLIPDRFEAIGTRVRVMYLVTGGELVITQQLVENSPTYVLSAPPSFPADSLSVLRAKLRR